MTEFKIGNKYIFGEARKEEVEIVGYIEGFQERRAIRFENGVCENVPISMLSPMVEINPNKKFKVGQEVWVKGKILNTDYGSNHELQIDFAPTMLSQYLWIHKSAEIKPCEAEEKDFKVGDKVVLNQHIDKIICVHDDGIVDLMRHNKNCAPYIYKVDKKNITKIKD